VQRGRGGGIEEHAQDVVEDLPRVRGRVFRYRNAPWKSPRPLASRRPERPASSRAMIAVLPSRFRTKVARDSRIPMTSETFCRFRVRTALTLPPTNAR